MSSEDKPHLSRAELKDALRPLGLLTPMAEAALALATVVHFRQRRQGGGRYLDEHIYPVTAAAAAWSLRRYPEDAAKAATVALLHDTMEDHSDHVRREGLREPLARRSKTRFGRSPSPGPIKSVLVRTTTAITRRLPKHRSGCGS
ncbi:MAG: hypothetical protein WEB00_07340 [Dehalococcoidia bacterium]